MPFAAISMANKALFLAVTAKFYYLDHAYALSRLTIVSREAKKSQRPLSELFTRNTAKKLANALAKPP